MSDLYQTLVNIPEYVQAVTDELKIPGNLRGRQYLEYAIYLMIENPEYQGRASTALYPDVAKAFNVTVASIERGVRYVLEKALKTADTVILEKWFDPVSVRVSKLSSANAIISVANVLRKQRATGSPVVEPASASRGLTVAELILQLDQLSAFDRNKEIKSIQAYFNGVDNTKGYCIEVQSLDGEVSRVLVLQNKPSRPFSVK